MSDPDPTRHASRTARGAADLELGEPAMDLLRSRLVDIAQNTVTAIIEQNPDLVLDQSADRFVREMGTDGKKVTVPKVGEPFEV